MAPPILYSFRRCPYAIRARMALRAAGVVVRHREVKLGNKPAALLRASAKGTVPVLVLESGQVIDESLDVMRWALDQDDPQQWLPKQAWQEERVAQLLGQCDGAFKVALDRAKYVSRYPESDPDRHWREGAHILRGWDELLTQPWLMGPRFGILDAALGPFVRQFRGIDTARFEAGSFDRLKGWLARFIDDPRFTAVMVKHPVWEPPGSDLQLG